MEELMNQITPYIMIIITAIAGYIAKQVKVYIDGKIDKQNQEKLMDFIRFTVDYVEQIGFNLDSEAKLNLAKEKVVTWSQTKGIPVSETEVDVLIEAFVHNLFQDHKGVMINESH